MKSSSQTCENQLPTGLLGRRYGWFWGVPVPPISCLCPLHDHWRCPTKAEGGHWIGGGVVATSLLTFMLSSFNLKPILKVIPHLHFWLSLPKKTQVLTLISQFVSSSHFIPLSCNFFLIADYLQDGISYIRNGCRPTAAGYEEV